jgi:flagella basal body P-ring formation protein FlgA
MNIRLISLTGVLLLASGRLCLSATSQPLGEDGSSTDNLPADSVSQTPLTIYLPRDVAIEDETLTLGKIAVITGEKELASKAGDIELGKFSVGGQNITIDRSLILSRLACSGMPACNPVLSGAEKVSVRRKATVIKASSIVESASLFLADFVKDRSIARWEPVRMPADVTLPAQNSDVELAGRLVSRSKNGQAVVEVSIAADGKQIETCQVIFRPKYNIQRAVIVTDVKEGEVLTADNTKIEDIISDAPSQTNWSTPYGLVAASLLPAGTVVGPNMAKPPQPPVVIERNQNVVIRIERAGLIVTAIGKSTQQGKVGDCIKVKNIDSQRLITAKVNKDGTVEPVF